MAQLNIAIAIAGVDQGANSLISAVTGGLGGLADVAGNVLTVGLGAATVGIGALVGGLAFAASEAMGAQDIMAQTEAAIKSTGGAAGLTATQIADMATALSTQSRFSDDAIQQGENLLLTFTNIGKDVFPDATQAMVDMATAMHTDAAGGAIQLGKALNDPVAGISALSRVGVTFTEEQKKLIESLQETGDMAGAQRVILAELTKEFGGSAAASAETFGGKLDVMKNQLLNVAEAIGGPLLGVGGKLIDQFLMPAIPTIVELGETFAGMIESITSFTDEAGNFDFIGGVTDAFYSLGYTLEKMGLTGANNFFSNVGDNIIGLGNLLSPVGDAIKTFVGLLGNGVDPLASFGEAFRKLIPPEVIDTIFGVANALTSLFNNKPGAFFASLSDIGAALGGMWAKAQPAVSAFIQNLIAWIQAQVPVVINTLQAWGTAFVAWIDPMIPPLLAKLGELLNQAGAWIVQQYPILLAQLSLLGQAFTAWITPQLPGIFAALGNMLGSMIGWLLSTGVPTLITGIGQLFAFVWSGQTAGASEASKAAGPIATAFIDGFMQGFAPFGGKISQIITDATNTVKMILGAAWLTITLATTIAWTVITTALKTAWDAIVVAIGTWFIGFIATWQTNWDMFVTIISTVWEKIKTAVGNAVNYVKGLIQPLLDMISNLWTTITNLGKIQLPSIPGFASGADFIVPPGFPNDSFPMRVQSGEHVTVTPAGKSQESTVERHDHYGLVINNYGSAPNIPLAFSIMRARAGAM